jgi:hypothetical protein
MRTATEVQRRAGQPRVRFVTPLPLIGMLLPNGVRPSGPEDTRTRTRVPYAQLQAVSQGKGQTVIVHTHTGSDYYFGGGQLNSGFRFEQVSAEIAKALESAGYRVSLTADALTMDYTQCAAKTPDSAATIPEPDAPMAPDVGTAVRPMDTSRWTLGIQAFVLGAAIALPVGAAIAAVAVLTHSIYWAASILLGGAVGYAVATGASALPVPIKRLIAVLATMLGVAVWVYIAARQELGITKAPLVLPRRALATAVADETRADWWIVLSWLLALFCAALSAGRAADRTAGRAAGAEPESLTRRARLHAWSIGSGRWPIAAMSLTIGLVAFFVLARVPLESGTANPMARLTTAVCFNLSETQFAVLPCTQPHDNEVYYRYMLPPGSFPGDHPDAVTSTCDARLADYVGTAQASALFDWPLTPDQFEWAAGNRFAVCALARLDSGKITGSAHQPH